MRQPTRRTLALGLLAGLVAVPASVPAFAQDVVPASIAHRQSVVTELSPTGDPGSSKIYTQLSVAGDGPVEVTLPDQSTRGLRNLGGLGRPSTDGDSVVYGLDATPAGVHRRTVANHTGDSPVELEITYALDGETVADPKDLVGRSGELTVTYVVRNTTVTPTELEVRGGGGDISPETVDVGVPLVGQLSLPLDARFGDVRAGEANVAGDARGNTLLNWDLVLFEPLGAFEQTVSWSAHVTDAVIPQANVQLLPISSETYQLLPDAMSAFADTNAAMEQLSGTGGAGRISMVVAGVADGTSQLLDGMNQLADGSEALAEGLQAAASGSGELADGTGQARAGAGELASGLGELAVGAGQLAGGTGELRAGAGQLSSGLGDLSAGAGQLAGGTGDLRAGAGQLSGGLADLAGGAGQLADGTGVAAAGSKELVAGMQALEAGAGQLAAAAPGAKAGADALLAGAQEVDGALGILLEGGTIQGSAYPGLPVITSGANDLSQGLCGFVDLVPVLLDPADPLYDTVLGQLQGACTGAQQLHQGVAGTQMIVGGIRQGVSSGDESLVGGLTALSGGLGQLVAGINQLNGGAGELLAGGRDLSAGLQQIAGGAGELAVGAGQASAGSRDLAAGAAQLDAGAGQLAAGAGQAAAGSRDLAAGTVQLNDGANALATGAGAAAEGGRALATGLGDIDDGANQLAAGLGDARDGSGDLAEGMGSAREGVEGVQGALGELDEYDMPRLMTGLDRTGLDSDRLLKQARAADERAQAGDGLPYGTADGADASAIYEFEIAGVGTEEGASVPVRSGAALLAFGVVGALGFGVRRRLG